MEKAAYIYFLTNKNNTVLYTGVTSDLPKRIWQHRNKTIPGFTSRYQCHKLVYFEVFTDMIEAITREKQIKKWRRVKKENLIIKDNPDWDDLYGSIV